MTIREIMRTVGQQKRCSRGSIYAYLRKLEIEPVGSIRQKPQQYPEDSASLILAELGLNAVGASVVRMPRLRHERARVRKARAA